MKVLPIHMGVILRKAMLTAEQEGTPHTHGGDSGIIDVAGARYMYSPYTWG